MGTSASVVGRSFPLQEVQELLVKSAKEVQAIHEDETDGGGASPRAAAAAGDVSVQQQLFAMEERLSSRVAKVEDQLARSFETIGDMLIEQWNETVSSAETETQGRRVNPLRRSPSNSR